MDLGNILLALIENFVNLVPRRRIKEGQSGFKDWDGRIQTVKVRRYFLNGELEQFLEEERQKRKEENQDSVTDKKLEEHFGVRRSFLRREPYELIDTENLPPGAYWFVPIKQSITIDDATNKIEDTSRQDFPTSDGIFISVAGTITHRIYDMANYYRKIQNDSDSVLNLAEKALAAYIGTTSFEELKKNCVRQKGQQSSALEKDVLRIMKEEAKDYGIEITSFGLTQFTRPEHTYRFVGNGTGGFLPTEEG